MKHTLTTERLREIAERRSPSLRWGEAEQIAAECLANREAQPVGFYTSVSGRKGVVWHNGAPEDDTAIYTAPPAPAVVNGRTAEGWMAEALLQKKIAEDCRAAMLAQPVSQGYKLPPHVYRELVNALRDTAVKYNGTDQLRERLNTALSQFIEPDHPHTRTSAPEGCN